jgi:arabinan endo-1,5-alpha-L-arabinosidase
MLGHVIGGGRTPPTLVAIGKSRSLSGYWQHAGSVLHGESIIPLPGRNDTWAPDVHKVGDTFQCYYSVSTFGSQSSAIGLATSTRLEAGSWRDHGVVFESSADAGSIPANITNAIDPNLFVDPVTERPWLTYGSFFGDLWQLPLTPDLTKVAASPAAVQVSIDPAIPRPEEGSYLSYHAGWYYLRSSHGICCGYATSLPAPGAEYSIRLGRSKSAGGPFVDRNGTLLTDGSGYVVFGSHGSTYGPGGQGVLTVEGRDVLYYHYFNKDISLVDEEALLGWNWIQYVDGWPVLVGK